MKRYFFILTLLLIQYILAGQEAALDSFIHRYVSDHNFSGTILIRDQGREMFHKSFGMANRPFAVMNENETKYKIASVTKIFTSALVMQLFEKGKIDLNATVSTYLPGYKGSGGDKITIRHLLNHTSGLPYVGPTSKEEALEKGMEELQMPHTIDEIISKYYSRDLIHEPGTAFSYSNGDYIILGRIIETLYNKTFKEVLNQQIIEPMRMTNTGLLFQQDIIPYLANSYFTVNDSIGLVNDLPVYIENWYSAGAMYSTTADLAIFSDALFSGNLVNRESLAMILRPGLDQYGFGVWVYDHNKNERKIRVYKRPGDIMGTRSMMVYLPDYKLSVIILANTDSTDLDDFIAQLINNNPHL